MYSSYQNAPQRDKILGDLVVWQMIEITGIKGDKRTCACMVLARDAATTISRCMESIIRSGCFEQIVVMLDSRSKDATGVILMRYAQGIPSMQIVRATWTEPGDFAKVRNEAISLFRTEYGFWLDTDDELVDPAAILRLLCLPGRVKAYNMYYVSVMGPGEETLDMYQPRIFPIVAGVQFECPALERLDWSLAKQGIETVDTNLRPILHRGYLSGKVIDRKNKRNKRILRLALKDPHLALEQRQHILTQYASLA